VNVNWNDDGWNVNANALDDNRWNDDNQVFSRNYWSSPAFFAGVLLSMPFFQPQSILPTSSIFASKAEYCGVVRSLFSQVICKKNLKISSPVTAFVSRGSFCSGDMKLDKKISSSVSRNARSIF